MCDTRWKPRNLEEAFFPVERRDVFLRDKSGDANFKKVPGFQAIVDSDRQYVFSVVTNNYKLVTNEEAYELSKAIMKKVFKYTKMSELECYNIVMPKTKSFCHMDMIKVGSGFFPFQNDEWTAFLRITNSYNRTRLLRFQLGFCRSICKNGIIFGEKSINVSYAHTKDFSRNVENWENNIGEIRNIELKLTESLKSLQRFYVPAEFVLPIACKVFNVILKNDDEISQKRKDQLLAFRKLINEHQIKYYSILGPHGYSVLNVLTDYASMPCDRVSLETLINSYQTKCGDWIDDFITSISNNNFDFYDYIGDYSTYASNLNNMN